MMKFEVYTIEDLQKIGLKIIRQYKELGIKSSFNEVEYLKTSNP